MHRTERQITSISSSNVNQQQSQLSRIPKSRGLSLTLNLSLQSIMISSITTPSVLKFSVFLLSIHLLPQMSSYFSKYYIANSKESMGYCHFSFASLLCNSLYLHVIKTLFHCYFIKKNFNRSFFGYKFLTICCYMCFFFIGTCRY